MEMSLQEAFYVFKALRWGGDENITCPCCGVISNHYFQRTRKTWRCKDCGHTLSVTSGTIFAFHKPPLKVYLAAIAIYANAVRQELKQFAIKGFVLDKKRLENGTYLG